jgi:hypothetical protein
MGSKRGARRRGVDWLWRGIAAFGAGALALWGCGTSVVDETGSGAASSSSTTSPAGSGGATGSMTTTGPLSGTGGNVTTTTTGSGGAGGGGAGPGGAGVGGAGPGGAGAGGSPACVGGSPPTPDATAVSDPPEQVTMVSTGTVLHKELDGFPNYGATDTACDVLYDGNAAAWVFTVPNVAFTSATLALSLSADDHASVPIDQYALDVWSDGTCVFAGPAPITHGMPFGSIFTTWSELDLPVTPTPGGTFQVTVANRSMTGSPVDWIAVDWIELRLTP